MSEGSIELYFYQVPTFRDQDKEYSEMVLTKPIPIFGKMKGNLEKISRLLASNWPLQLAV